jgi:hypothetical protein
MNIESLLVVVAVVYLIVAVRASQNSLFGVSLFVFLSSITMMPALPVVGDRLSIADFVMVPTLLGAVFRGQLTRAVSPRVRTIDRCGLAFISLCSLSSAVALMTSDDSVRILVFMAIYLYGYLCFRLMLRVIDTPERLARVCLFWAAGAMVVIVVGFLAATGVYRPAWAVDPIINRISSTMKSSGQVSSYIGPATFILIYLATSREVPGLRRMAVIGLIGASGVVLLGTGSRISFVIMVFALAYAFWTLLASRARALRKWPLVTGAVVGAAALVVYTASVWADHSERYALLNTSPFERSIKMFSEQSHEDADLAEWGGTRYEESTLVLDNLWRHPIFGVGSGMFTEVYRVNEVHNTYFGILGENGLLSFVAFVFWWFAIVGFLAISVLRLRSGYLRYAGRLVLGAFLVLSIYQVTTNGMRQRPFWFTPAIAVAAMAIFRKADLDLVRQQWLPVAA